MTIYSAQFPKFQITAPPGWYDATERDKHASICFDRELTYAKRRRGPGYGGYLCVQTERTRKGFETRTTSKSLLKLLLDEGKAKSWGEPYDIICEEKPLLLAAINFTYICPDIDVTKYLRLWRIVKGRIALYAEFISDIYNITPDEYSILIAESEAIIRSFQLGDKL